MLFPSSWREQKEKHWSGKLWWQADVLLRPNIQTRCQTIAPTACLLGNFQGAFSSLLLLHSAPRWFFLALGTSPSPFLSHSHHLPSYDSEEWGRKSQGISESQVMSNFLPQTVTGERGPQDLPLTLGSEDVPTSLVALKLYMWKEESGES